MERAEQDFLWWVARGWTHVVEILNRARRVCASVSSLDKGLCREEKRRSQFKLVNLFL